MPAIAHSPANPQPAPTPLPTCADVERLLAEPGRSSALTAYRDRALLELLWDTGLQASELAGLNVADVALDQRTLRCGAGSRRQRTLGLSQRAGDALADYLACGRSVLVQGDQSAAQNEQTLFLNHRGQRLTRQGIWLIVRSYAVAVGMDGRITPRTLRRSVTNRLIQSGVGPQEAMARLGLARLTPPTQAEDAGRPRLFLDGREVTGQE